ncbi:MFS transporter [Candidatus Thorarchaeota archaeon]|nr:MAG: MFS transporter [Candidatus Thorarchaeota archaeon]
MSDESLNYVGKLRLFKRDARLYIASSAAGSLSWGISGVIFNLYLQDAGFSEDFIGFFLSISMFATAAIAFIAGSVSDRMSRKKTILRANVIAFIAVAIQYTVLDQTSLILSQIFIGLTGAFTQVSWSPYITEMSTDRERAHLFGFAGGVSLLAVLAGNLLGGYLPGFFADLMNIAPNGSLVLPYRFALWLSLVPNAISILLVVPMSRDTPSEAKVRIALGNVKNWGFIGRYATTVSVVGLGAGIFVMFMNLYFANEFSASSDVVGLIFAVNTIILSLANFLAPALADRIGKVRTVVLTEALSVPFLILLYGAPTIQLAVLGYVLRTVLMNMAGPVSNAFFMEGLTKEERATAVGVVRTGDSLVRGLASNVGGILLAAGLYRLPFLLSSGLYVISIVLFYVFFKKREEEMILMKKAEVLVEAEEERVPDAT